MPRFTVHRFGATNNPVPVDYAIGGTASNGVDYVALPGSVTVAAGERSAQITVVPIDDGSPDITSTVILKLKRIRTTSSVFRLKQRAIILDSNRPSLSSSVVPDLSFHMNATGPDGAWFHIEIVERSGQLDGALQRIRLSMVRLTSSILMPKTLKAGSIGPFRRLGPPAE